MNIKIEGDGKRCGKRETFESKFDGKYHRDHFVAEDDDINFDFTESGKIKKRTPSSVTITTATTTKRATTTTTTITTTTKTTTTTSKF